MARAFRINPADNVATMLEDVTAGTRVELLGGGAGGGGGGVVGGGAVGGGADRGAVRELIALEPIANAHKIAASAIPAGQPVIKFGVPIGFASRDIPAGAWVHLHNVASRFDQRSQTLDVQTGATTDTRYE